MKRIIILLALILPSVALAQADSLNGFLQFYPLQNGDYWEYTSWWIDMYAEQTYDSTIFSIEILGDTILANGLEYKIIHKKTMYDEDGHSLDSSDNFERIDSSDGSVYLYAGYNINSKTYEYMMDRLFAQPGDIFQTSWGGFITYFGEPRTWICDSIVNDTIFGMPTKIRAVSNPSYLDFYEFYDLAKGLGLFYDYYNVIELRQWGACNLVYAKINGVEYGTKITAVVKPDGVLPGAFGLLQNYPNPFNPSTVIGYQLTTNSVVTLKVYDVLGREVRTLVSERQNAGNYSVTFEARNLPSGVYFYRLEAGTYHDTKKLLLLK